MNNTIYRQLIGSLTTHPNLFYVVSILSKFMRAPRESNQNADKRILRYIQGTKDFGLLCKNNKFTLTAYSKVDFEGDIDDETSTSGYLINMGLIMVSWSCEK